MDPIERMAHLSVSRACGFGALAIFCFMVGLSYHPALAAKMGGTCALIMALILVGKGLMARRVPYRRTETWLLLETHERPRADVAQAIIGRVLREVFFIYARASALLAALMLGSGMLLALAGL